MTEKKQKTIVPCCCLYKHAFRFSLRSNCGFTKKGLTVPLFSLVHNQRILEHIHEFLMMGRGEPPACPQSGPNSPPSPHTHGVYISAALTASLPKTFNNSPRISFAACRNKSRALIFDAPGLTDDHRHSQKSVLSLER